MKLPLSNTDHVTLNVPILFAAAGVALAVIAAHIATGATNISPLVSIVAYALVLLTAVYALFTLAMQALTIQQEPEKAPNIYRSATMGALILGLVTLAMTDTNPQSLRLGIIGFCLCAAALISFLLITLFAPDEIDVSVTKGPGVSNGFARDSGINEPDISMFNTMRTKPSGDVYADSPAPSKRRDNRNIDLIDPGIKEPGRPFIQPPLPRRPRVDPSTLPPLFVEDPLYRLPRPQRALFFTVTKGNDSNVSSDDACIISDDETKFALCDGASGSSIPRPWAALLGQNWSQVPLQKTDPAALYNWLAEPRAYWHSWMHNSWKRQIDERNSLLGEQPMPNERFNSLLQKGAAATFLGLKLDRENKKWSAVALGDTCLFIFHRDPSAKQLSLPETFPLKNSAQFNDQPSLLYSTDSPVEGLFRQLSTTGGPIRPGDIFLMATDALAQWLMLQIERQQPDWQNLLGMTDQRQFADFIYRQRQRRQGVSMVDDDTTLVMISF